MWLDFDAKAQTLNGHRSLRSRTNEQKMFPHTHDTFCCALAYRMIFSMKKFLVLNLETKVKM